MVKVSKIAVWKVGDLYIEDAKEAVKVIRKEIIREVISEDSLSAYEDEADYFAHHWEAIDQKVKAALAGT